MKNLSIILIFLLATFFPFISFGEIVVYNNARIIPTAQFAKDFVKINTDMMVNRILNDGATYVTSKANIKGLWIFDQTGATSTISDRSGNSHDITLRDSSLNAINASTCSPGISGLAPYLTFNSTHVWNTPDHSDFSFVGAAYTLMALLNPAATSAPIINKWDNTTASKQREYSLELASGKLYITSWDNVDGGYIGRSYNTSISTDIGSWHTYMSTKSATETSAAHTLYRDGTKIDDTDAQSGSYTLMANTTSLLASYTTGADSSRSYFSGSVAVIAVIAEEITATQAANWNRLLRSYAGVSL